MKISSLLSVGVCLGQAMANIPVQYKVMLNCDHSSDNFTGCLRGMSCAEDFT